MDVLDFALKPLSAYIPDETFAELRARSNRISFTHGECLQRRGDQSVRLCLVNKGAVRLGRFQHSGAFTMITMVGPGAHFGDVGLRRRAQTHDVHAVGDVEIDVINGSDLEALLTRLPDLGAGLWRCNTDRMNALMELYEDARTLSIPQRLAKLLYVHVGRGEMPDGVACLQRDLAALLGVTHVSISTALRELESADLIAARYRCIEVPNKERLGVWLRNAGAA